MSRPRVLVVADVPGWAWARKAEAYQRWLSDQYEISVVYHAGVRPNEFVRYDLIHLFEVTQTAFLDGGPPDRPFRAVAGLTAAVWETWGEARMREWASRVDALHGNSLLIANDLKQFHARVYYTPNGVDPEFFRRWHRHPTIPVFGHVGKPNPRKGAAIIIEAARLAHADLKLIQRTSKLAYGASVMAAWYQGISVMVCASNMDGTPNPALEGAATECAVLSTPIGNMPEFIKNAWNGFLTDHSLPRVPGPAAAPLPMSPEDAAAVLAGQRDLRDELIDRMRWFCEHPAETIEMGRRARQAILADWTWEKQVAHVAAMWREVLG